MGKRLVFALAFVGVLDLALGLKRFTLKGDALWPTAHEVNQLATSLTGTLTVDGSNDFVVPHVWNRRTKTPVPGFIAKVANAEDISKVLEFARQHVLRVSVLSTGHHQDTRNIADQGVLLDMSLLNHKEIDVEAKTLTVGPGQKFGDIFQFVAEKSGGKLVAASGADPSVGPAGWTLGGGHGRLTRMFGLGADILLSADIVLANGTKVTASSSSHADLFRAIRGGGGSTFGVVSSLTFPLFDDPGPVTTFGGFYPAAQVVADGFQEWMKAAPNNAGGYFQPSISTDTWKPFIHISTYCIGEVATCELVLKPVTELPFCLPLTPGACELKAPSAASYSDYLVASANEGDIGGYSSAYFVSTAFNLTVPGQLAAITQWIADYSTTFPYPAIVGCTANGVVGGASAAMDPDGSETAVAPALRKAVAAVTCYMGWEAGLSRQDMVDYMDGWAETTLRPLGIDGWVYWNEAQHNQLDWQQRYWGGEAAYRRLLAVKQIYDPDNVLACYHCVGWEDVENKDPAICPQGCSCSNMLQEGVCASSRKN